VKNLIKSPLITEKNTYHNAMGVYVFEVDMQANKLDIKQLVERRFKVKVSCVRTSMCRGRGKNTKYGPSKTPYWKKAYVKLRPGEKIALFEGA